MQNKVQLSILFLVVLLQFWACKTDTNRAMSNLSQRDTITSETNDPNAVQNQVGTSNYAVPEDWKELDTNFVVDIRYATENNFTKTKIYDCARCLLHKDVAQALTLLQEHLKLNYNLGIKVYDCYRPQPYQQRLWDVVPDASYVTPPAKGSMHSRGMAVDLTLVDSLGNEIEMGTAYDFFGKEAHVDFTGLPQEILENRKFLQQQMAAYGFEGIRTEWWHFSYSRKFYALSDFTWDCN